MFQRVGTCFFLLQFTLLFYKQNLIINLNDLGLSVLSSILLKLKRVDYATYRNKQQSNFKSLTLSRK